MLEFELNLSFVKTTVKDKKLHIFYKNEIFKINDEKITEKDLIEKIKKIIPKSDMEFFKIDTVSKNNTVLIFDNDKWFKKSIREKIIETPDKFEKNIRIGNLPKMILNSVDPVVINKFVEASFRNYLDKNKELKNKITKSIKTIRPLGMSYFNFNYDGYRNYINIKLKPEFRLDPMLFITKTENKPIKKMDFDSSVKALLNVKK